LRIRSAGSITAANGQGLLVYLKRVLWRFMSLFIGVVQSNRENSELSFIAYGFQPHPPRVYKGVSSVRFGNCNKRTFLTVGLLVCLQRV